MANNDRWRLAVEKLASLRPFLLGYRESDACVRNQMQPVVGKWLDGIDGLFRLYDESSKETTDGN